jgi:hypothetical protein
MACELGVSDHEEEINDSLCNIRDIAACEKYGAMVETRSLGLQASQSWGMTANTTYISSHLLRELEGVMTVVQGVELKAGNSVWEASFLQTSIDWLFALKDAQVET